jgi:sterol desaturase/sphingolipid hydroxylase (fatty acid hydroxylase superfamily)
METLFDLLQPLQSRLFEGLVLPFLYHAGMMSLADNAYDATGIFTLGLAEMGLIYLICRPLEAWRPVEPWQNRHDVRVDVLYTFLYRSGLLPLVFYFALDPLLTPGEIALREAGYLPPNLEELVPWLQTQPLVAFLVYALLIDFAEYWRHRLQHRFHWWWALHAVHHSQRRMSFWTDDRNHVVDGLLQAVWLTVVAHLIGVPGSQFMALVLAMRFVESFSHANVKLDFGWLGERLLVSPHYHRLHHGIGVGHEGRHQGCNFATLFPLWDMLFGTAHFGREFPATGIRDQLDGVDYGAGFWRQQGKALARLWRSLMPAREPGRA